MSGRLRTAESMVRDKSDGGVLVLIHSPHSSLNNNNKEAKGYYCAPSLSLIKELVPTTQHNGKEEGAPDP